MNKEEYCFYRFYHNFYEVWYGRRKNLDFHDCDWRHVQELMTFRLPFVELLVNEQNLL